MESRMKETAGWQQPAIAGSPGGDNLDSMRGDAERMLAASDATIDENLSGDSEAFLTECRQEVGQ